MALMTRLGIDAGRAGDRANGTNHKEQATPIRPDMSDIDITGCIVFDDVVA
ncbi:MAG: hypothetical protein AAGF11_06490 [Myxococcota bacterium]